MKRLIVVLVGLLAACAFAATASAGFSDHHGDDNGDHHGTSTTSTFSFCVAGETKTPPRQTTTIPSTDFTYGQAAERGGYYSYSDGHHLQYTLHDPWTFEGPVYHVTFYKVTAGACGAAATSPAPPEVNVFLCYSAFQGDPGVWPVGEAAALLKSGYWSPYAVPNTVAGGTNIGGYHLVCNVATGQSAGTSVLGGAGEVYGSGAAKDVTNVPGHYSVVGP
jgi:hypothetical protein